jgi:PhzF family phenazine biosynthesis protein
MSMSRSFRIFQVDAFTNRPFCGNPAGVVLDADTLAASEMQAIARELNNGDTAFLLAPDGADHDLRVRFFTPRTEAGFVGHATLAAHAVLASLGLPERPRQKQRTGIVTISREATVDAAAANPGSGQAFGFAQSPPRLQGPLAGELLARTLSALQLQDTELDQRLPPVVVGEASTRLLIALSDPARLATLQPDLAALAGCSADGAPPGFFAYAASGTGAALETQARMYCPALGIPEDPVSGNAHAMMAHWLCARGLVDAGAPGAHFTGRQGHHMGRPGSLRVDIASEGGTPRSICISGQATIVFEARLNLPGA